MARHPWVRGARKGHLLPPTLLAAPAATDDVTVGLLALLAGAVAQRGHAPGRDRVAARRGGALAAAVRVVDGVHRRAAGLGAATLVARAPGLAQLDVLVLGVADRADRRPALGTHHAHLPRGQAQRGVVALLRDQLDRGARREANMAPAAGRHLLVVPRGALGDAGQRQAAARLDLGAGARLHRGTHAQASRGQDVGLVAVGVVDQRDVGAAVGVVLDRCHAGGHAVLAPLEVDLAVPALGPAAAVARGDAPMDVAPAGLRDPLHQRLLGVLLGHLGAVGVGGEPAAGAGGLVLSDRHQSVSVPSNSSIESSGCSVTTAFFHCRRLPEWKPRRFGLGLTFWVRTPTTRTPKISSIAWRTWGLLARSWMRNVYLLAASRA